jgi:hypothetical protein
MSNGVDGLGGDKGISRGFYFSRSVVNFLMIMLGLVAAYFTTIGAIRIELAEKAESKLVATIETRLSELEVVIIEGRVKKDEFYEFRNEVESRLARIESFLIEQGR